jgi:hypothetical protein
MKFGRRRGAFRSAQDRGTRVPENADVFTGLHANAALRVPHSLQELHAEIETIRRQFPGEFGFRGGDKTGQDSAKRRRRFSPATRKKMARAQKRRWAKIKRAKQK